MNKLSTMKGMLVTGALILTVTLLSSCTVLGSTISGAMDKATTTLGGVGNDTTTLLTACHATGDPANPYEEITITYDISPVPANGCPAGPVLISEGKITICHATDSETNPYNEITVSVNGLDGHGTHEGDVFPGPEGGCPTSPLTINPGTISDGNITICHATGDPAYPYEEITVNNAEWNAHLGHLDDIRLALANGCPAGPGLISDGKITICHATDSQTNPYNEITVSVNGLDGHDQHEGDIFPGPEGGCPTSPWTINDAKITICHATGSETNPYNEITVSVNGLNGHDKHEGDFIPAPGEGCTTSPGTINPGTISNGKITICHATGSKTNPYNEITVSVNGLNGHGKHGGDIIPAPAGGCPSSPQGGNPNNGNPNNGNPNNGNP